MADHHLFDANPSLAVVERVQHVDERGPDRQFGHPVAGHHVRRDGPRRACELEAPQRLRAPAARDYVELAVEGPRREDDVDGALVRVHHRHETTRPFDAGLFEDVLLRSVAFDVKTPFGANSLQRFLSLVDDDIRDFVVLELSHDLGPHAAVAADDEVVTEVVQVSLQLTLSPVFAERVVSQGFGEDAYAIKHGRDANHDQGHREDPACRPLRMDFPVADGADGDDHHVEGIQQVPTIYYNEAATTERDHTAEEDQGEPEQQQRVYRAPPAHREAFSLLLPDLPDPASSSCPGRATC